MGFAHLRNEKWPDKEGIRVQGRVEMGKCPTFGDSSKKSRNRRGRKCRTLLLLWPISPPLAPFHLHTAKGEAACNGDERTLLDKRRLPGEFSCRLPCRPEVLICTRSLSLSECMLSSSSCVTDLPGKRQGNSAPVRPSPPLSPRQKGRKTSLTYFFGAADRRAIVSC